MKDSIKKIDIKTVAGVGVGVLLGHFVFKVKNPFLLIGLGVGGGLLGHSLLKDKNQRVEQAEEKAMEYVEKITEDIEHTIEPKVEPRPSGTSENTSSAEGMSFNKSLGYIMPTGTVDESYPEQFMDIDFQ